MEFSFGIQRQSPWIALLCIERVMPTIDIDDYLDDDTFNVIDGKRIERKNRRLSLNEKRARQQSELMEIKDKLPVDIQQSFSPSFLPGGHERVWLINYLEEFYNKNIITDVVGKVKGGKEANVYCCAAHPATGLSLVAAKIYRPRMFRNLRNDARYRQGREIMDEDGKVTRSRREMLAIRKNTRFGQVLRQTNWLGTEYQILEALHAAGADVPRPMAQGSNVILMEYIGDASQAAPTLNEVRLSSFEAKRLFERLVDNVGILLANHCVHADLSAYNILYWKGAFKIIDMPQAVDPRHNPDARAIFERDVQRVCQYFARYGVQRDASSLAQDLWQRYEKTNALDAGRLLTGDEE
jgi:RIO kinase 1